MLQLQEILKRVQDDDCRTGCLRRGKNNIPFWANTGSMPRVGIPVRRANGLL